MRARIGQSTLATPETWRAAARSPRRGRSDAREPMGGRGRDAHGADEGRRARSTFSISPATTEHFPPWRRSMLRRAGSSARPAISSDLPRSTLQTRGPGSIMADGRCVIRSGGPSRMTARRTPYAFLGRKGAGLHQIPVGPVHAGIIEPGHFRFHAGGEAVVRLEERLGYVHKGVDSLTRGASIERAAVLAARVSGDSTVAYSVAFARAVEAALGIEAPARAHWLRGLMAELERLANHFGDIGAICNDAAFSLMHAHCGVLRERTLRAAQAAFGHRLMMDAVAPGGVAVDLIRRGDRGDPRPRARGSLDFPKTRPALRQHRLVAGQDGRNRRSERRSRQALRRGRRRWPRVGTRFRRPARSPLSAVRSISASRFRPGARAT